MADTNTAQTKLTEAEHTADIERWVAAGLGDHPYCGTREGLEKLSDTAKAVIRAKHPHHWERLMGDESKLSADLALRLRRGELRYDDIEQLESANYEAASQWLRAKLKEQTRIEWEAGIERSRELMAEQLARNEEAMAAARAEQAVKDEANRRATLRRHLQQSGLIAQ